MGNRINIYDIARFANVSTTTVYKVIHGKKGVSGDTRNHILDIIRQHGYKANIVARTLARGTLKIGVIIENYCSAFCEAVFDGIKGAVRELEDYNVEAVFGSLESSYSKDRILDDLHKMKSEKVDGVIIFPYFPYNEYPFVINELAEHHIPVVVVSIDIPGSDPLMTVSHNYEVVGELGAELLSIYNPGGKNALFIGNRDVAGHNRIKGSFENRLSQAGGNLLSVYETQDDETAGYYLTEKLLRDDPDVNGIFVGTTKSSGICKKIVETNRAKDIQIICVDTFPEIISNIKQGVVKATIYQNPYLQGAIAVKRLAEYLISHTAPEKHILINPRIVLRSNCEHYKD